MYKYHFVDSIQASTISSDSWICTKSVKPEQNQKLQHSEFQEMVWRTEKYFENEYVVLLYLVQPRMCYICRTELSCIFYTTAFEDYNVQMHIFLCCYNRAAYIKAGSLLQVGKTKSTFSVLLLNLFHPSSGRDVMTLSMGISNRSGCWNF